MLRPGVIRRKPFAPRMDVGVTTHTSGMEPAGALARPPIESVTAEDELRRWYWLRTELAQLARALGVTTTGSKLELTERLADTLGGRQPPARARRVATPQLAGPLDGTTVIPVGQRCTQQLRAYFTAAVGRGFRFDGPMRAFISSGGATLDQAVEHWHLSREREPADIAPQFEYNRFTREWRADNPDGDREALLAAWRVQRNAPRP